MDCFDSVNALNALVAASLILSGGMLMAFSDKMAQNYGSFILAVGYLLLGLAAVGLDVSSLTHPRILMIRRVALTLGSIALIVSGKLLGYYSVINSNPNILPSGNVTQQSLYKAMIFLGAAGFVLSVSYDRDGFNLVKAVMAAGSVAAVGLSSNAVSNSTTPAELSKNRWLNIGSWGLIVLAVAYKC